MPAPIALFVFNRPWHTAQTILALQKNVLAEQSDLIIFCDGARSEADAPRVAEVRGFTQSVSGFKSVTIIESPENKGLANSIIFGVTKILSQNDAVIVLEDDMVTSEFFLSYMNQGLSLYANDDEVISINAYMFPIQDVLPETFFLKGADCWGWATWKRGWRLFEPDTFKLLKKVIFKNLTAEFDFDNSYPYTRQLIGQYFGLIDSWAIRWYASAFLNGKLSLYPNVSLVDNIGFDNSGTHTKSWSKEFSKTSVQTQEVTVIRTPIVENQKARNALASYFRNSRISISSKILLKLKAFRLNFLLC